MQANYGAPVGGSGPVMYSAAATTADDAPVATDAPGGGAGQLDPRFDAVNQALQAGNGDQAAAAARQLIATLQAEKPPQPRLLDQARMSLAAASMLKGDLDGAGKALLGINPKKLDTDDQEHYTQLRDLLKDARRESFSAAFQGSVDDNGVVDKAKAKAAAVEAGKLVEFLQKAEPGNTGEIAEAKLKQANALLVGNDHRGAEKVLAGINEKLLDTDQKEYLNGMRNELHAQQTDALALGYQYDMRHKKFKDAVSDSTALVNDLVKYFPDDKERIVSGRLKQATAQVMNGDMEDARKSLGRISQNDLKEMPADMRQGYAKLDAAVKEHFENMKKLEALQKDMEAVQGKLKNINDLATSGDKAKAQQAVPLAEQLLASIKEKYPDNTAAIEGAKLTLANAKLAAGDIKGGKADLDAIAGEAQDPAIKDEAHFLQARAAMKEGHTDQAVKMLQSLVDTGASPEMRKAAKDVIISVEADHLKQVDRKTELEAKHLNDVVEDKRSGNVISQFFSMPSRPITAMENFERDTNILNRTGTGAVMLASLMKKEGLTLAEIQKMPHDELVKKVGAQTAGEITLALGNPDVKLIAKHDFDGGHLSWQNNTLYVDPSYLDSSLQKISHWIGDQVRTARSYDEELKASDSSWKKAIGYGSAFILDRVSDANNFIKDKIKIASDFYNDPERKDTWYAKLGRAGTFGGDMLTSVFTMPATIVDYKASDDERAGAILGTAVMVGTMGLIKGGGPAWKSLTGGVSRGASGLAASRLGQWVAKSEFGQIAGRGAAAVGRVAGKVTGKLGEVEARFEETGFAKGMDKVKVTLGKLNPTIGGAKFTTAKSLDAVVDDILKNQTPAELRASVTAEQIAAKRQAFTEVGQDPSRYTDDEIRAMVVGDKIYSRNYNPVGEPKPARTSQADFDTQLRRYDGPAQNDGYWHRRYNKPGPGEVPATLEQPAWWTDGDVRRFYFNVKPDRAAELADFLADKLNDGSVKFQFKMPQQIGKFNRADSGILYVQKGDYAATKKMVMEFAKKHPDAFVDGSPAFTKSIGKGISVADEPIQGNLPPTPSGAHSFGSSRSDIAAEAILRAPANASKEEIKQLVQERMRHYGFNPDKPWLKQNATVDDL
jgi:hypothetical protein